MQLTSPSFYKKVVILFLSLLPLAVLAEGDRIDYDLDDDGLIEINDLNDLNNIRNHLTGDSLYGSATGCPAAGCEGFELTKDLSFDANRDGVFNELDPFWNQGKGWLGIGQRTSNTNDNTDKSKDFQAIFEGNGHSISYLYFNNDLFASHGLFSSTNGATIRNVGILGASPGSNLLNTGGLAGLIIDTTIKGCYVNFRFENGNYGLGGLIGTAIGSSIIASYGVIELANPTSNNKLGVLVGTMQEGSTLAGSYGVIVRGRPLLSLSDHKENLLVWNSDDTSNIIDSYFAFTPLQSSQFYALENTNLTSLKCATGPDAINCLDGQILYQNWADYRNIEGKPYWQFGTNNELPYLSHQDFTKHDSDGDGIANGEDALPYHIAASVDTDGDGRPDGWNTYCNQFCQANSELYIDQFPAQSEAWKDFDVDGKPDQWSDGCDLLCQSQSILEIDTSFEDEDNDGIIDTDDTDANGDGLLDADADSDGLIDIRSWQELDAIRYNLLGHGRTLSENGTTDASGCPPVQVNGEIRRQCNGYELLTDLDFDTSGDDVIDQDDLFWNSGLGWEPIGPSFFTGTFEGNGHVIRNLWIDRRSQAGLFNNINNSIVRNLGFTGTNQRFTTALAGIARQTQLKSLFLTGQIRGYEAVSLVDQISDLNINSVFVSLVPPIDTNSAHSAAITRLTGSSTIEQSFVASGTGLRVKGISNLENTIDSYWISDRISFPQAILPKGGQKASHLSCRSNLSSDNCANTDLTSSWSSELWDFGDSQQLPGLKMGDQVYRDSDGDGVLDRDDAFPFHPEAALDQDRDSAPDRWHSTCDEKCVSQSELILDNFVDNPDLSLDTDLDGLPDTWNISCGQACQNQYSFDPYPNDFDNDAILDLIDTDDNNDGVDDTDLNSNGLIDISNIHQLNAVRYALNGHGQRLTEAGSLDSSGCPPRILNGTLQRRCRGFELLQSINFDTNQDGQIDTNDDYWDDEKGWLPLGATEDAPFRAVFDGNGHELLNWFSKRWSWRFNGIFGYIYRAEIRSVGSAGSLTYIAGGSGTGGLVGYADSSKIIDSHTAGRVEQYGTQGAFSGASVAAGLSGLIKNSLVRGCFSNADIASSAASGLVGSARDSLIYASYSSGHVNASSGIAAGLVYAGNNENRVEFSYSSAEIKRGEGFYKGEGFVFDIIDVIDSYWAFDYEYEVEGGGIPVHLDQLKCPTQPNDTDCSDIILYENWDQAVNEDNITYWVFGSGTRAPILNYQSSESVDSDGDKVIDRVDDFPYDPNVSLDADGDGSPDGWTDYCDHNCQLESGYLLDQFPQNKDASIDNDLDGQPDQWNLSCDDACQQSSSLTLDLMLSDSDNDGIDNSVDADDNGDGIIDADADSNGLIDIDDPQELNAMRFNLRGIAQQFLTSGPKDPSGCPIDLFQGVIQAHCSGYELINDINMDSLGWVPVGETYESAFEAIFEGNGHIINNLYINLPPISNVGLFGLVRNSQIRNVGITNANIVGSSPVGGLVGNAVSTDISGSFIRGSVIGSGNGIGGLVGSGSNVNIQESFSTGLVKGYDYVGGLIGGASHTSILASYAEADVVGHNFVAGLLGGYSSGSGGGTQVTITSSYSAGSVKGQIAAGLVAKCSTVNIEASFTIANVSGSAYSGAIVERGLNTLTSAYFATDSTGQRANIEGEREATLAQLKCPTSADNLSCANEALYENWDAYTNTSNEAYWSYGSEQDLPFLIMDTLFKLDYDQDGIEDKVDAFPRNSAVSRDGDKDGLPDNWNSECDVECQQSSKLHLDSDVVDDDAQSNAGSTGLVFLLFLLLTALITPQRKEIIKRLS